MKVESIITSPSLVVKDYDNNEYPFALLRMNGYWLGFMLENLRTTHYADGTPIPVVEDKEEWKNATNGACCLYNNDPAFIEHGLLYNFYVTEKTLIRGWDVPGDDEWKDVEKFFGMPDAELDGYSWRGENEQVGELMRKELKMNMSGYRYYTGGSFGYLGYYGWWWTSTLNGSDAWGRYLNYTEARVFRAYWTKSHGFSVRCVRIFSEEEVRQFLNLPISEGRKRDSKGRFVSTKNSIEMKNEITLREKICVNLILIAIKILRPISFESQEIEEIKKML